MKYYTMIVPKQNKVQTVYSFLKQNGLSERMIRKLRKQLGLILINNTPSKTDAILKGNDELKLSLECNLNSLHNTIDNTTNSVLSNITQLDIVYEDDYMLAINKPAGLSCIPTRSHYDNNLGKQILEYLKQTIHNPVLRIPYRLDLDTAGLILAYKSQLVFTLMKDSQISKVYHAILSGKLQSSITIDAPIETIVLESGINLQKRVVSEHGKHAITHLTPIQTGNQFTLVEAVIETGRTHQIRLHSSHIGHPLVGDALYGTKNNQVAYSALICKKISFIHPIFKTLILLEAPYPSQMRDMIESINLE